MAKLSKEGAKLMPQVVLERVLANPKNANIREQLQAEMHRRAFEASHQEVRGQVDDFLSRYGA